MGRVIPVRRKDTEQWDAVCHRLAPAEAQGQKRIIGAAQGRLMEGTPRTGSNAHRDAKHA